MNFGVTEYDVKADTLNPLKFAFVSDLHDFPNHEVLGKIAAGQVDAVLVGGDFIHGYSIYKRGFEFLAESAKIAPTFCVLGNHETGFSGDIRTEIKNSGAVLLDNDFTNFGGITLGGVTSGAFYPNKCPNAHFITRFSQQKGFKLLLCHHPEYFDPYIKDTPIDLVLSGHAHGGQWRLFGRGLFAPGQGIFPKYSGGIYDGRLIVCRGLGNLYFVPKINNPPEILIINLIPKRTN